MVDGIHQCLNENRTQSQFLSEGVLGLHNSMPSFGLKNGNVMRMLEFPNAAGNLHTCLNFLKNLLI